MSAINTRSRLRRRVIVAACLLLVISAAISALVVLEGISRQIEDVTRTYEVRNHARELTMALAEAESSQRGFLLTGNVSYVEPFKRSVAAIETRLKTLVAATVDDASQAARVDSIQSDVALRLDELSQVVQLVESGQRAQAFAIVEDSIDNAAMRQVQSTLEQFIAGENEKLLVRSQGIASARRLLVGALILALAGAVVLAYFLFSRTQRQLRTLSRSTAELTSQNELLEERVRERTQAAEEAREHAERERQRVEAVLRDTNHRIGNSLATVSSLLGLQMMRTQSAEVRIALEAARSRVHAIASAHRRLRLGGDLETASADEFLSAVVEDLQLSVTESSEISITSEIEPIILGARDVTTLGILVGELVTNAIKHAFPQGRKGEVLVRLVRDENGVPTLTVADNGVGLPSSGLEDSGGLGSVIVTQLAHPFGGVPRYSPGSQGGLSIVVPLPHIEASAAASRHSS